MNITLYKNTSDNRVLDKNIVKIKTVKCHLKTDTDIYNPVFVISEKNVDTVLSSVNYLRSNDFGRYYFINNIKLLTGHEVEISCHVDVLSSFKNYIRNSKAVLARQEFYNTPYIVDDKLPVKKSRYITEYNFNASPFSIGNITNTSYCVALTVTGGAVN